jgi:hypothetical protein
MVLWLAIVIYSIGLAAILHLRPSLMFHENGTWKEFGYQRAPASRYTIFPFWLFAVAWAFVSYAVAAAVTWIVPAGGAAAAATALYYESNRSNYDEESEDDEDGTMDFEPISQVTEPPKRPRGRPRKVTSAPSQTQTQTQTETRPGYYVLDPASKEEGLHRYIYYGPTPPPAN